MYSHTKYSMVVQVGGWNDFSASLRLFFFFFVRNFYTDMDLANRCLDVALKDAKGDVTFDDIDYGLQSMYQVTQITHMCMGHVNCLNKYFGCL